VLPVDRGANTQSDWQATSPSAQVVEALARALRVSDAERDLLFRLAGHATPGLDVVSSRITPSVQRLLDRLEITPVAVFDATWTLLIANAPYDALMGQTTSWRGNERNSVWRNLVGPGTRVVHSPEEQADFEALLVADLRLTSSRYPADQRLKRLTRDLAAQSPRFVELWESSAPGPQQDVGRHKVIDHPAVGRITLDCDTLIVAADDLRIMIYTAEPETEDAERLTLAIVVGTQAICDITTDGGTTAPPSGLIRKAGLLRMQINYTHEDTRHDAAQQTVGRP
jgi:MmyB-like transcription regulator ligand binding domain